MDDELKDALDELTGATNEAIEAQRSDIKALRDQLDRVELKSIRPPAPGDDGVDTRAAAEKKVAFVKFLRHGADALSDAEAKAVTMTPDTAGGYLAPEQFVVELLRNITLFSGVRTVARVAQTSSGTVKLPRRTGRPSASWVGETQARPETAPTYGMNAYPVGELACYVDVSNAMLEDAAFDIAVELSIDFAEEFGRAEGEAFVNGNGILSPLGFMQHADVAYTVSGAAAAVTADGLIDIYHAVSAPYRANGTWGMNSNTLGSIRKLKDGDGNYIVTMGNIAGAPATTLLGRPIVDFPDMPDIAAGSYPVVFGDFMSGYRIFDRVVLSVLRDPFSQATNGMTRFHARRRVAGGVGKPEALRKMKIAAS